MTPLPPLSIDKSAFELVDSADKSYSGIHNRHPEIPTFFYPASTRSSHDYDLRYADRTHEQYLESQQPEASTDRHELNNLPADYFELFTPPDDLEPNELAYNPSAIMTIDGARYICLRVEPSKDHLGKSVARFYRLEEDGSLEPIWRLGFKEEEHISAEQATAAKEKHDIAGEDPAVQKVRVNVDGVVEEQFLVSAVLVTADPDDNSRANSIKTTFHIGTNLNDLEPMTAASIDMKDVRACLANPDDPDSTELDVYGRPQGDGNRGAITHVRISDISMLSLEDTKLALIDQANIIDKTLITPENMRWMGNNHAISVAKDRNLLFNHMAQDRGVLDAKKVLRYVGDFRIHNIENNTLIDIGVVIEANDFYEGSPGFDVQVKEHSSSNLTDVFFSGGITEGKITKIPRFEDDPEPDIMIRGTGGCGDGNFGAFRKLLNEEQHRCYYEALRS